MEDRYVLYPIGNATVLVTLEDAALLDQDLSVYGTQVIKIHKEATTGVRSGQRVHPALVHTVT